MHLSYLTAQTYGWILRTSGHGLTLRRARSAAPAAAHGKIQTAGAIRAAMAMMAAPTLGEGALVCSDAEFAGEVHVGEGSILHPRCRILARGGPIRIGRNNVIEELVEIV